MRLTPPSTCQTCESFSCSQTISDSDHSFKDDPYPFDEWQRQADAGHIEPDWEAKADAQFEKANGKDVRRAELFAIAKLLKSQYKRLGVAGYCWGGWGAFHLGAKGVDLVDCISVAHPAFLVKDESDAIGVPVQLNIPENDEFVTNEFKEFLLQSLPKTGVAWMYQHYPGMEHGFATRGNGKEPAEARAMILAKDITVTWFRNWLAV